MADILRELRRYSDKIKVSDLDKAKHDVLPVVQDVITKINSKDPRFQIEDIEYAGSVYQKLKIGQADEFDFDLPIRALAIDHAEPGPTQGMKYFSSNYSVNFALNSVCNSSLIRM